MLTHDGQVAWTSRSRTQCPLDALRLGGAGWSNPIEYLLCHIQELMDLARLAAEHATPGRSKPATPRLRGYRALRRRDATGFPETRRRPRRQRIEPATQRSISQQRQRVLPIQSAWTTRQPRQSVTRCRTNDVFQSETSRTVTIYRKMRRFRRWPVEKLQQEMVAANVPKEDGPGERGVT